MVIKITALAAIAATVAAMAVPTKTQTRSAADSAWEVINWRSWTNTQGAPFAPPAGEFEFYVSAPEQGDGPTRIPPFYAYCTDYVYGTPLTSDWSDCALQEADEASNPAVAARVLPIEQFPEFRAYTAISYQFTANDGSRHNITANFEGMWNQNGLNYTANLA